MTFDFSWKKLDTKPLGIALARGKIPRWTYNLIIARKPSIEHTMERIEKASEISPFPPTVLIPEGVYDSHFNIVVHAHPTIYKENGFVYPIIELSAPSVLYMPESWFLGLLAHEFLHYVVHTVDLHKKLVELESKGDSKSPAIIGVIPDKEKMTLEERDHYFYGKPNVWFKDDEVIQAVEELESKRTSTASRTVADKVMKWMNERKLMKEFKRGGVTGFKGKIWLHQSIIKKAKGLGLV